MNKITRSNGNILIKLDNGTIIRSIPTDPYGDDKLTCIGKVVITNKEINLRQILIPDTLFDNCYFGYSVDVTKDGNIITAGKYAPGIEYAEISNLLDDTFRVDADITTYSYEDTDMPDKEWVAKDL